MPATITSIEVRGYNGNGKVKRGRRDPSNQSAHQRFNNLKPNLVVVSGADLHDLTEREIKITYSTGGHSFAILELVPRDSNSKLDVYFVVWTPDNDTDNVIDELDLGDLTITVETVDVNPTDQSGTDDDVIIED